MTIDQLLQDLIEIRLLSGGEPLRLELGAGTTEVNVRADLPMGDWEIRAGECFLKRQGKEKVVRAPDGAGTFYTPGDSAAH